MIKKFSEIHDLNIKLVLLSNKEYFGDVEFKTNPKL